MKQTTAGNGTTPGNARAMQRRRLAMTPLAGAVRSVLAISGTLLALSGSGTAFAAGTCFSTAPNTFTCDGEFTTTLPGTLFAPVIDMTLILGAGAPTSVTPGAGEIGVDATWGGNVGVTSFADITTQGADGLRAWGTTSTTVDNQGSISTQAGADGGIALSANAIGDVSIVNAGDVLAAGTGVFDVTAIDAWSSDGNLDIQNTATATISAQAQDGNAIAVLGFAEGSGALGNAGSITATATGGVAIGVLNQAYGGDATTTNTGHITADSAYHQAIALLSSSSNGMAGVDNAGTVTARGGDDQSAGILASGLSGSSIANTGTITVDASLGAITAAQASTADGQAAVVNRSGGRIVGYTSGVGDLTALWADSTNGTAHVDNAGFISLKGAVGEHTVIGMAARSGSGSTIDNAGFVFADSKSGDVIGGLAVAQSGDARITNAYGGYVRVVQLASGNTLGLQAEAFGGNANVTNDYVVQSYANFGNATGIRADAAGGDAQATNTANITSISTLYGNSLGMSAVSSTGEATASNSGQVWSLNAIRLGRPSSDMNDIRAMQAFGYSGATVANTGKLRAEGAWAVRGVVAVATLGDVLVTNAAGAQIDAMGFNAVGILAETQFGDYTARVDNAGGIFAVQVGDCACNAMIPVGVGIQATSLYSDDVVVTNSGSIDVISQHGSYGVLATSSADVSVDNSGRIDVFSTGAGSLNIGVKVYSYSANASIVNTGDIHMEMGRTNTRYGDVGTVHGMRGVAGSLHPALYNGRPRLDGAGDVSLVNEGNITAQDFRAGYGMYANADYQQAVVTNAGDITLTSEWWNSAATGMFASAKNWRYAHDYSFHNLDAEAIVRNTGNVLVTAQNEAKGIRGFANYEAGVDIVNAGNVVATAFGSAAYGVTVASFNFLRGGTIHGGTLAVDNSGSLAAINHVGEHDVEMRSDVRAVGIKVSAYTNEIAITNSGDIVTDLTAGTCRGPSVWACWEGATVGSSVGILAANGRGVSHTSYAGDISVLNTGTISSSVHSSSSIQTKHYAYFPRAAFAAGVFAIANYGDVHVTNAGDITVSALGDGFVPAIRPLTGFATIAAGISSSSFGSLGSDTSTIDLNNSGSIAVSAEAVFADGTALASGIDGLMSPFNEYAYDNGLGNLVVFNDGFIHAASSVTGAGTGIATANGIAAVNTLNSGQAAVTNNGRVQGVATGPGTVFANGVLGAGSVVDVQLEDGSIVLAQANGADGTAIGLSATGDLVTAGNAGVLEAEFVGAGGSATGAWLASTSSTLAFDNSGSITAFGDNATGVQLDNATATTLANNGSISAITGAGYGVAVRTGASADLVLNSGIISGSLDTGDGSDVFRNTAAGTWDATGTSLFGAGDDSIANAGALYLDNAIVDLGTSTTLGNSFNNTGWILVSGANTIDMGASNQQAFLNNGTINFRNGVVGDTLHIVGNLGGSAVAPGAPRGLHSQLGFTPSSGSINFDVSGLNGTADLLYVDGNVLAGTYNTVNINLLDLPTTAFSDIALIHVAGDSTASSFRLGQVNYDANGSFMTLAFNLVAQIDSTNATPDVFSLGTGAGHVGRGGELGSGHDVAPPPSHGTDGGHELGGGRNLAGAGGTATQGGNGPGNGNGSGHYVRDPAPGSSDNNGPAGPGPSNPTQAILDPRNTTANAALNWKAAGAAPQPAGLALTGLSDSGTMAASLAPGVQSLLGSEVGSWRQRLGIVDKFHKGSVALWARLFQDSGKVSPDHVAGNFGQGGNFAFDQRNSGIEVGADFAVSDTFSAGLLVGQADARQSLQETGAGVSRIDGDTFGGYATWISEGFYVDASYRHMSFDARLNTSSGELRTSGDADAFSIEGGYAWTVGSGFTIEPQLQYTRISVDDMDAMEGTLATFNSTGGVASRGRLGVMGRKAFASGNTVWTPYVSLNVVREFDGENGFNVNENFFGQTSTRGTSALVETGLDVQVGRFSVFGGLNWQDGGALDSIVGGQLGARYAW